MLGAGLLALAAVEAGLLLHPPSTLPKASVERTPATSPLGAHHAPTQTAPPERSGGVIAIAADSTTLGTTLYRLWGSGRIEASVLGESNIWTDWVPVAPGLSGAAPQPRGKDDN